MINELIKDPYWMRSIQEKAQRGRTARSLLRETIEANSDADEFSGFGDAVSCVVTGEIMENRYFVSPRKGLYTATELNKFMHSLIPRDRESNTPLIEHICFEASEEIEYFVPSEAYQVESVGSDESALLLGYLYFVEFLGTMTRERQFTPANEEAFRAEAAQDHSEILRDMGQGVIKTQDEIPIFRQIYVHIFPSKTVYESVSEFGPSSDHVNYPTSRSGLLHWKDLRFPIDHTNRCYHGYHRGIDYQPVHLNGVDCIGISHAALKKFAEAEKKK